MKNLPKEIYLQVDAEEHFTVEELRDEDFLELEGVTWCSSSISKNDIRYIRYDEYQKLVAYLKKIEEFEAKVISNDDSWNTPSCSVSLNSDLFEDWSKLQAERNDILYTEK